MSDLHRAPDAHAAAASQLAAFMREAARGAGRSFENYAQLHAWACGDFRAFWSRFLDWCALDTSGPRDPICTGDTVELAQFFPQLHLNYAQSLLRPLAGAPDTHPAVIGRDERGNRTALDRGTLRAHVLSIAARLVEAGLAPGDRVVAVARNSISAVQACLGSAAVGATWSSVAPDLGTEAVIDRFRQLEPVVLFADLEYVNHGATRSLETRVAALLDALPSVRLLILMGETRPTAKLRPNVEVVALREWLSSAPLALEALPQLPFNHPLYVMFSSGTTGAPKCIVHGAGGTLLEHLKEHRLHTDLGPSDRLYFHTSCGWMMWNWQLSALASGTPIVLYDGSVSFPDATGLLRTIDEEGVTVFGTSPAYLQLLKESGISPRTIAPFAALRAIQSTGSILYDAQFDWIRDEFKHVPVQSISGGTDIIGCFVLGNPLLPVYRGESQCVTLGVDVRVATEGGIRTTGTGELVCVNPFPSRPVRIWGDANGARFHDSYFSQNADVWTHGDQVTLTEHGSARILGRSDGTLKIRGVRIGPAELYSVVLAIPGILEAMAVEQQTPLEPGGTRIALLVVLAEGRILDRPLELTIKRELNQKASPVHVPGLIVQVDALPQTHNGKYSERAARDVVNGRQPPNRAALRNPECLDALAARIPR